MPDKIENRKFPKLTIVYIIMFMIITWIIQILIVVVAGNFDSGNIVTQLQSVFLTICMFIPAIVLIIFCLLKKIKWNDLGLKPLKPLYWIPVFGIILIIQVLILISILWFSDFPNFIIGEDGWKLKNIATIIRQPNPPVVFIINSILSMMLATIITIPQALGEELAWRGYLQNIFIDKFGIVKGLVFLGIIWGLFHLPINLSGYNHPGSPVFGAFIHMTITCISLGIVFGWIRMKTNSVWPCAVAHAAYNTIGTIIGMAEPRINISMYYFYLNGIEILIGLFFLWLIIRDRLQWKNQLDNSKR